LTVKEIAENARVKARTAHDHALKLAQLGIFEQAEVFPAHRYRLSRVEDNWTKDYLLRMEQAIEAFGLSTH